MLNIYRINKVEYAEQTLADIEENGGTMWIIDIKTDMANNILQESMFAEDGGYDGGWPMGFSFTTEWGFRVCELSPDMFDVYTNRNSSNIVTRRLYTIISGDSSPKEGEYCAFLNQYDKRISNEEIINLLTTLPKTDEEIIQFEIGSDNNLHKL